MQVETLMFHWNRSTARTDKNSIVLVVGKGLIKNTIGILCILLYCVIHSNITLAGIDICSITILVGNIKNVCGTVWSTFIGVKFVLNTYRCIYVAHYRLMYQHILSSKRVNMHVNVHVNICG